MSYTGGRKGWGEGKNCKFTDFVIWNINRKILEETGRKSLVGNGCHEAGQPLLRFAAGEAAAAGAGNSGNRAQPRVWLLGLTSSRAGDMQAERSWCPCVYFLWCWPLCWDAGTNAGEPALWSQQQLGTASGLLGVLSEVGLVKCILKLLRGIYEGDWMT